MLRVRKGITCPFGHKRRGGGREAPRRRRCRRASSGSGNRAVARTPLRTAALLAAMLLLGWNGLAEAETLAVNGKSAKTDSPSDTSRTEQADGQSPVSTAKVSEQTLLKNIVADQKRFWSAPFRSESYRKGFIVPFLLSTGVLIATDKHIARELSEGPPDMTVDVSRGIAYAGSSVAVYGFAASFYGIARLKHNERARETGLLALEALTDSTIVVMLLKAATQRQRPTTDEGRRRINDAQGVFFTSGLSFPSGHAINGFALASVLAARYPDRPLVKYSAYGTAAAAALGRMTARKHFPSDILVGSVLGYLIGHHVVKKRTQSKRRNVTTTVLPYLGSMRRAAGITVQIQF